MASTLPSLPVKHHNFVQYIQSHLETPIEDLVKPYNDFDASARKIFAQNPSHALVKDNYANIVPLFDATTGSTDIRVRARDLNSETPEQKEKYILPIPNDKRRLDGSHAVVPSLSEFQNNFALFTEGALSELDWSNVVAAGSAVVTSLLPVPEKYRNSKRGLRQFYHEEFAPASDVDLFLYGLTEEQAIEKIKHIEDKIRNTILYETTTIRTKNTITIASQYPTRHVQIVLRIYKSVAEILTGFDVDCSCAAYDGQQVYASPRAVASYITQTNQIDLTRRSPSYENRLSKYSHRGFEVFWPPLDRSKVDPTIFERSFMGTEGLARLLVLEKLPKPGDRDTYLRKRREERGRPPLSLYLRRRQGKELHGNIKDDWEDEVPEWQEEDQISDYHTFTIPYGRRFNAKKIEKLLYTKDLLLNAQWNQKKDREVYLHRHPAFFGEAEHVIGDCCGFCPQPVTDEERKVAEEESKIYISGKISFIKDDPGRQEIGSFNPITETDWTEMAYIGRTELLCQAIVSHDLEAVKQFLDQEDSDPDRRDYTGRTPLQLACMSSTPEIVQCLVDRGARLIARMADGQTALHLAAARGATEIVSILLKKSNENEEAENQKKDDQKTTPMDIDSPEDEDEDDKDDASRTSASYVKVDKEGGDEMSPTFDTIEENDQDPDIYDINVTAWDNLASPLHLAIIHGHVETVKELVTSFGADVLMPIKITDDYSKRPKAAILTLVLVLALPLDKAREMSQTLLKLGASPAQGDTSHYTALHYIAQSDYSELLDVYQEHDGPAMQRAINHMVVQGYWYSASFSFTSALVNALCAKNSAGAKKLLDIGATPTIELADCLKALKSQMPDAMRHGADQKLADKTPKQPLIFAIENDLPLMAIGLLKRGADPNIEHERRRDFCETALDCTRRCMKELEKSLKNENPTPRQYGIPDPVIFEQEEGSYLADFQEGTYKMFAAKGLLKKAKEDNKVAEEYEERLKKEASEEKPGEAENREAVTELIKKYELLIADLLSRDAKTWQELHPGEKQDPGFRQNRRNQQKPKPKKTFKIEFFNSAASLSDVARGGYEKLFEAAWNGNLDTIKSLTLCMWGPAKDQLPLRMSQVDASGLTCLHILILRGHLRVAKAILQILRVQYKVKEPKARRHFEMDLDSDGESDDEGLNIVGHIVDEQFTYENVGEVASQVESEVSPRNALERALPLSLFLDEALPKEDTFRYVGMNHWSAASFLKINTLFKYAIFKNDLPLLEWLLKAGNECARTDPSDKTAFTLGQQELQLAMILGHTECLGMLIQSTAVGLPLLKMSKDSGIAAKEEPQYYQGLSIRGQKRKDWADAGRPDNNNFAQGSDTGRPPVLISALQGNMASTEWLLGTAPSRYYLEYVNAHLDDENVQRLSQSKLGLEASVLNWLQTRNNLVLHCAVMSRPCEESERLVQYLADHHPECLEVKSSEGHTPLALAISYHRLSFARILIKAGANQAARDTEGCNLLHLVLCSLSGSTARHADKISQLIDLMDKDHVSNMLTQRAGEGSRTPFARWLHKYPNFDFSVEIQPKVPNLPSDQESISSITKLFLTLGTSTNHKFLELLDGAGNTPVHECVKRGFSQVLEPILDHRPDLLYRENATGSTPLEMAVDAWVNETTRTVPKVAVSTDRWPQWQNLTNRRTEWFIKNKDWRTRAQMMVEVCQKRAQQSLQKRKLVSLFEANEVAKRLAAKGKSGGDDEDNRYDRNGRRRDRREEEANEKLDEVALWGGWASQWK
ncbi:uncharacterized protein N7496_007183 [Penicillium cataractarum]|uniref:Ankyrin repeat protein n=1 Tax=Penicillium cataractarum TaxID=2100454 RepID=A0A9W9S338_9EURO|nr:uncharacterized protein N7496_007183 [Penicillium cataractarum]KAJ5371091.1 hypothetical protein N7496_007183 [Penicillium cataractarum]